jgi:hypothetical protein
MSPLAILILIALVIIGVSVACGAVMFRKSGRLALGLSTGMTVAAILMAISPTVIEMFITA